MSKKWIIIIVLILFIVVIPIILGIIGLGIYTSTYNNMVIKEEAVNTEWSNVEAQYQRRNDLIPNLVNTIKGFAEQEKEVLIGVTEARAKATSVSFTADNLTPENMHQFQAAQGQLYSALSRLLISIEKYPELQSNQNFLDLQAQLEGTENRLAVSRQRFNEIAQEYNTYIRVYPNNFIAGWAGFEKKPLFQAEEGAEKAPQVQF